MANGILLTTINAPVDLPLDLGTIAYHGAREVSPKAHVIPVGPDTAAARPIPPKEIPISQPLYQVCQMGNKQPEFNDIHRDCSKIEGVEANKD